MNTLNPALSALRAALESPGESRSIVELEGRRWVIERFPEPGVEMRMSTAEGGPPGAESVQFSAASQMPRSYPDWLPFVPGYDVAVSTWGPPACGSVAWSEVPDARPLIEALVETLEREGWSAAGAPAQPVGSGFWAFERTGRKRVLVSTGISGKWVVILSDYPAGSSSHSSR